MFLMFNEVSKKIIDGDLLHIAGTESLLRKLPKGNWIGGSTEYFIAPEGGKVSNDLLFVTGFPYQNYLIKTYSVETIKNVANDAFDNGFSVIIVPFDSAIHKEYAENAAKFDNMFMHNIAGWISGINLSVPVQTPICVNGAESETYTDKAVALHLEVPKDKKVAMDIVNIFEQDESAPLIEFTEEGFSVRKCFVNGKEMLFADYIKQNGVDTKMPLVGNYSGTGVNVSFKTIENDVVYLYAPVFRNIQYRMAKGISDYKKAFISRLEGINEKSAVFSCNCILNFLYGGFDGKSIGAFTGPVTFGEIAYQLVNQTLVYVTVSPS